MGDRTREPGLACKWFTGSRQIRDDFESAVGQRVVATKWGARLAVIAQRNLEGGVLVGRVQHLKRKHLTAWVTPHSLRHGDANREYERVTDRLSPVQVGTLAKDDPDADRAAPELVADELGHSHISAAHGIVRMKLAHPKRPDEGTVMCERPRRSSAAFEKPVTFRSALQRHTP